MRDVLEQKLIAFKRKTITIDELEKLLPQLTSYENFAALILQLERDSLLDMIQSKGRNHRQPSLAYHYRINKHQLNRAYYQLLQTYRLKFHDAIDLDAYFKLDQAIWVKDLPYIEKINSYIKNNGFPAEKVPAPERSFELVGDEKWIEQGGSKVLHRICLWDKMNIFPVSDPLMFAVNPYQIDRETQLHLIVENKTTYQALLPKLPETAFSTLIYGSGEKISKSMENFSTQYPVKAEHAFLYFGDIDRSGIAIWHHLNNRQKAIPAIPFYAACLDKEAAFGKTNQRLNDSAVTHFLAYFSNEQEQAIRELLEKGAYYPQEVLKTSELQQLWLQTDWDCVLARIQKR